MIVQSPCKINLGLKVINQREDGYHNILSYFVELNLFDSIKFVDSNYSHIKFTNAKIPTDNTVSHAIKLLENYCNITINHQVQITKNIPLGSGLGGGSSNGAYTLKALNYLYNLNTELLKIHLVQALFLRLLLPWNLLCFRGLHQLGRQGQLLIIKTPC